MKPNDSNFSKSSLNLALKYLSIRARSVKETTDYLAKKGFLETDIKETIKKLLELKFLNDDNFARSFIESRQRKGKSKQAIAFELKLKGIGKEQSKNVLKDSNEDIRTATEYIEKRTHQFDRFDKVIRKKKIISRLKSRGFDWNTISKVLIELNIK